MSTTISSPAPLMVVLSVRLLAIVIALISNSLAITRNDSKLREYKGPDSRQTSVSIYSGAGQLVRKIPVSGGESHNYEASNKIVGQWTDSRSRLVTARTAYCRLRERKRALLLRLRRQLYSILARQSCRTERSLRVQVLGFWFCSPSVE